jgi:hypothetical protein
MAAVQTQTRRNRAQQLLLLVLLHLAAPPARCNILQSTISARQPSPSVVVLTHYDKPDWRLRCGPLLFSLERERASGVDHVLGYLNESAWAGAARREAECRKSRECTEREARRVFNNMNKYIW